MQWSFALTGLGFMFALGAIVGSFINVLVYRLPRGMNVVVPASACPHCGTTLTWRENFPILGWLWLGGKCRFCRSRVSAEYPVVELFVAVLFALTYVLWFMEPSALPWLGLDPRTWRADFAVEGLRAMWPTLLIMLVLLGSLVAATLIDARTFHIPLILPWAAMAIGFVVHPLHAAWIEYGRRGLQLVPFTWTIPVPPTSGLLGMSLGGVLGIAIAAAMLRLKWMPQSFADYAQWEAKAIEEEKTREGKDSTAKGSGTGASEARVSEAAEGGETGCKPIPPSESRGGETKSDSKDAISTKRLLLRTLLLTGPALTLMLLGFSLGLPRGMAAPFAGIGAAIGLLSGLMLRRMVAAGDDDHSDEPVWTHYPHARREMMKEILFLLPCLVLATLGWWLCRAPGPLGDAAFDAPLWLRALGGAAMGFLAGGGLVWFFRIGGSLVLGKEAMGLGDVHLMAGVGACLGWMDPTLAFFTAPFMGIAWACLSVAFRQVFHTQGTALPYGPHLAAATVLVVLFKPAYELVLSVLFGRNINIP